MKQTQEPMHQIERQPHQMKPVAYIQTEFPSKFGIPRQSGLVKELQAKIILTEEFRNPDVFRGLEGYSHIWLIWEFSESVQDKWTPMVRPPRLGGNQRMGVFATRSPFRPNPIGLSSVQLERIDLHSDQGPVLYVSGADLMNGTPILDIKPYLPQSDCHAEASGGFSSQFAAYCLQVVIPDELLEQIPEVHRAGLLGVLANDPRPAYQHDPDRVYGMEFAGYNIKFTVNDQQLTVQQITKLNQ